MVPKHDVPAVIDMPPATAPALSTMAPDFDARLTQLLLDVEMSSESGELVKVYRSLFVRAQVSSCPFSSGEVDHSLSVRKESL